jgi:hypothetical protein
VPVVTGHTLVTNRKRQLLTSDVGEPDPDPGDGARASADDEAQDLGRVEIEQWQQAPGTRCSKRIMAALADWTR